MYTPSAFAAFTRKRLKQQSCRFAGFTRVSTARSGTVGCCGRIVSGQSAAYEIGKVAVKLIAQSRKVAKTTAE